MGEARRKKLAGYVPAEKNKENNNARSNGSLSSIKLLSLFAPIMIGNSFFNPRKRRR